MLGRSGMNRIIAILVVLLMGASWQIIVRQHEIRKLNTQLEKERTINSDLKLEYQRLELLNSKDNATEHVESLVREKELTEKAKKDALVKKPEKILAAPVVSKIIAPIEEQAVKPVEKGLPEKKEIKPEAKSLPKPVTEKKKEESSIKPEVKSLPKLVTEKKKEESSIKPEVKSLPKLVTEKKKEESSIKLEAKSLPKPVTEKKKEESSIKPEAKKVVEIDQLGALIKQRQMNQSLTVKNPN